MNYLRLMKNVTPHSTKEQDLRPIVFWHCVTCRASADRFAARKSEMIAWEATFVRYKTKAEESSLTPGTDWILKNWSWSRENRREIGSGAAIRKHNKDNRKLDDVNRERVRRSSQVRVCVCVYMCAWACCKPGRISFCDAGSPDTFL